MYIKDYLGMPKTSVEDISKHNIVAVNNVNGTVEVSGVEMDFGKGFCHAIFYFDLTDNNIMTMAIVKVENVSILDKIKIKLRGKFQCGEYIGSATFHEGRVVILTYLRENIVKAL